MKTAESLNDRLIPAKEYFAHFTPKERSVMDKPLNFHFRPVTTLPDEETVKALKGVPQ